MKGKVKLVVSDMDGTLLNDQHQLHPEFFEVYRKLRNQGILFVPASGRQYYSLLHYFHPIQEEIGFIAENGSYVTFQNKVLFTDTLPIEKVTEIVLLTRQIPLANSVVCGTQHAYVDSKDSDFIELFQNFYYQNLLVDNVLDYLSEDQIIKVAVHHPKNAEKYLYPALQHLDQKGLKVVVSGKNWIDIMNEHTNKGKALRKLQQALGISPEETIVFGDYLNDIEMLQEAYYSFAMENAHPLVKEIARLQTGNNNEFAVVEVLKSLLD
ncbi:Phosphatase YbjI [Weeksella virosa]|uniref:HAD family hydrolase n=1 Tax=Weeksella virosa TaxID=1014 RepID=UPI000DFCB44F|nr:HAD family hydrolase [Weeksella virosa]SUP54671.1 Phosphatase YbjI [Weeksella virosa]